MSNLHVSWLNQLSGPNGDIPSTHGGQLLQVAIKVLQHCEDTATDASGITATSKPEVIKVVLNALGVETKDDLQKIGGSSTVSKMFGKLTEVERVEVEQTLS